MTTIYRTAGAWGAGKGSDLTAAEVDENFFGHESRIANLETTTFVGIDHITVVGDQMTIVMTDHSIQGPFTLPSGTGAWVFMGAWAPGTPYSVNDVITANGAVYLVIFAHTSQASFSPTANDGSGHDFYALLISAPAIPVYTVTTTTFTPNAGYANSYIRCTNASGCIVTIPQGVFAVDTELHFRQATTNPIIFVGAVGVSIDVPTGFLAESNVSGATVTLKQVATDAWDIFGLLAPSV
jgi:hypothetical protein